MENKLRFGIVGTGLRGVGSFGEILKGRSDVEITALCDTNKVRLRLAAEKLNALRTYTVLDDMLEQENLDALIITTPDAEHEKCAIAALKHGVNILLDKPLATSEAGCRNIINAAKENSKIATMGFNLRHHPVLKRLKAIIDEGRLGRIIMMENREFYDGGRTYMARWNGKKSYSGGLWNHKGSHDFDVFNWLLNFPKPVKVSAFAGMNEFRPENIPFELEKDIPVGPGCSCCHYAKSGACKIAYSQDTPEWGEEAIKEDGYRRDSCMYMSDLSVHDNGIAMVEYDNGVRVSHAECFVCGLNDRLYSITGTRATAFVSLEKRTIQIIDRWTHESVSTTLPDATGGHGGADPQLVDSFIRMIKGEIPNTSTLDQGMIATAIAEAAELSKSENRTICLN